MPYVTNKKYESAAGHIPWISMSSIQPARKTTVGMAKNSFTTKKQVAFRQFAPADIYAGLEFHSSEGTTAPSDIAHCVVVNRETGTILLDCFVGLLQSYGHRCIQWYAARMGIKTEQLSYTISALTGYVCNNFMDTYLLLIITDLLKLTHNSITEVARRTGFPRASELSQFLQRMCGCSARELRMRLISPPQGSLQ